MSVSGCHITINGSSTWSGLVPFGVGGRWFSWLSTPPLLTPPHSFLAPVTLTSFNTMGAARYLNSVCVIALQRRTAL